MTNTTEDLDPLRFPIGKAVVKPDPTPAELRGLVTRLAELPRRFHEVVTGMSDAALDTPYRPGGWTVRQVVHHVPDSHANAYVRFKMAATEHDPPIRAYLEDEWAKLADSSGPVGVSLDLLDALHARWSGWLGTLGGDDWRRAYIHPQNGRVTLQHALQVYVWHGEHHLAHVCLVAGGKAGS